MQLLQFVAIACAGLSGVMALWLLVTGRFRKSGGPFGRATELIGPFAAVGATSGISLGLLGAGTQWLVGGAALLSIGLFNLFVWQRAHMVDVQPIAPLRVRRSMTARQTVGTLAAAMSLSLFLGV